jgi:hypothetical protein
MREQIKQGDMATLDEVGKHGNYRASLLPPTGTSTSVLLSGLRGGGEEEGRRRGER